MLTQLTLLCSEMKTDVVLRRITRVYSEGIFKLVDSKSKLSDTIQDCPDCPVIILVLPYRNLWLYFKLILQFSIPLNSLVLFHFPLMYLIACTYHPIAAHTGVGKVRVVCVGGGGGKKPLPNQGFAF